MWTRLLQIVERIKANHLLCQFVCRALKEQHPDGRILGARYRGTDGERDVVAVFYQKAEEQTKPSRYKLFAIAKDLSSLEELSCTSDSPYRIRGRK